MLLVITLCMASTYNALEICKKVATLEQMSTQQPAGDGKTTCLVCGKAQIHNRGLCAADYNKFTRARKRAVASGVDPEDFETQLVDQGFLLLDKRATDNVFMDLAEKMIQEENLDLVAENIEDFRTSVGKRAKPDPTPPMKTHPLLNLDQENDRQTVNHAIL